jgi:hypothetical protein
MAGLRRRFWPEAGLGALSALALVVTLLWHDWIEIVFRADPDGGDGTLEWLLVALLAAATMVSLALARFEWRRAHRPTA